MKNYISDFSKHIEAAITIGERVQFKKSKQNITNVVISGLGGSGIGGTITNQVINQQIEVPVVINKDYDLPQFVNKTTLFIACSYSGNTEETLSCLAKAETKNAEICVITSGGKLLEIANEKNYNKIVFPTGFPPRAAFGYSFPQVLFALNNYDLINDGFVSALKATVHLLNAKELQIHREATDIAHVLKEKTPVIYSASNFEGVAIRFRQQINENAKTLCWHAPIPEMNHNELVGWTQKNENLAVVILRNESDNKRIQKRMEINKQIFEKYTPHIIEIHSHGNSDIERTLYLIHLTDWVSDILAQNRGIDAVEVDVITHLKKELANL